MKYIISVLFATMLSACAIADMPSLPEAPVATLPDPTTMDNTELCTKLLDEQRKAEAWISYANAYASLAGIDLNAEIAKATKNVEILAKVEEARNILCKPAE